MKTVEMFSLVFVPQASPHAEFGGYLIGWLTNGPKHRLKSDEPLSRRHWNDIAELANIYWISHRVAISHEKIDYRR